MEREEGRRRESDKEDRLGRYWKHKQEFDDTLGFKFTAAALKIVSHVRLLTSTRKMYFPREKNKLSAALSQN